MEWFLYFDRWLFTQINSELSFPMGDQFFPWITDLTHTHRKEMIVLIVPFLIYWAVKQRWLMLKWLVILILAITLSDVISYRVIKPLVKRPRPEFSHLETPVKLRVDSSGDYSFPSNHAANMFATATVLSSALPAASPVFYLIAFLVGYSRVYVGVHFPFDVLGGALLGFFIALMLKSFLRPWLEKMKIEPRSEKERLAERHRRRGGP